MKRGLELRWKAGAEFCLSFKTRELRYGMLRADGSSDMSSRADAEKDGRHLDSIYQLVP